jgi:N-acetylmuramoyl-L-alanine amidase
MKRDAKIRKNMLKGVYEENAGIPRSDLGKRRPKQADVQSRWGSYRARVVLVVLFAVVSAYGLHARLDMGVSSVSVASQGIDLPGLPYLSDPLNMANGAGESGMSASRPADHPSDIISEAGEVTIGDYDTMLTQLGMPMAELFNLQVRTIVIDPGHGGRDPGATGHQGLMEKDIALDIAKRLRDKLSGTGNYRVLLTREDDRKVFLKERVAFSRENRADLFVSIHINSLPKKVSALNYVETYYFGPHSDGQTLELAEKENRESDYAMGDFRKVIANIGDTLKTEESGHLASTIQNRLYSGLKKDSSSLLDAGIKTGPFMVLLGVEVPSVLVEVSCISNRAEETRLGKEWYRDNVADYLKSGIVDYLEERGHRRPIEGGRFENVAKQER